VADITIDRSGIGPVRFDGNDRESMLGGESAGLCGRPRREDSKFDEPLEQFAAKVASRIARSSRNSRLGLPTRRPKSFPDMCASSGAVAAHTATVAPAADDLRNWRI
jgi:hypothetical protein